MRTVDFTEEEEDEELPVAACPGPKGSRTDPNRKLTKAMLATKVIVPKVKRRK